MKCEHCGTTMIMDKPENPYCPNDCDFNVFSEKHMQEEAQKSPEQLAAEAAESGANPPDDWAISKPPHCWGPNCNKSTNMKEGIGDPPYRSICKLCGNSLRQHPFFGEGQIYDRGNPQCVNAWSALTKQEKAQVYARYKFPIPKRLF
jgi:hypothetical protein